MKKFVVCVVIAMMAVIVFATVPVQAQTEGSKLPAEAQNALKAALADPPLSAGFLCQVYGDPQVAQYMAHAPFMVDLFNVTVYFSNSSGITLQIEKCSFQIEAPDEQNGLPDCFQIKDDAESSCCSQIRMELGRSRQSDFWKAFAMAIQPNPKK